MMITNDRKSLSLAEIPVEVLTEILKAVNSEKISPFGIRSAKDESWSCLFPTSEIQHALFTLAGGDEKKKK